MAVAARTRGGRFGYDGRGQNACPAGDIKEGEAYIEIQALDAKTLDSHGNPTRVKVRVEQAEN